MTQKQINLALISPQQEAVSETFIKAHKQLPFNVKFYYGGYFPSHLEGKKSIFRFSLIERVKFKFNNKISLARTAISKSFRKEKINCILAEYGPTACEILGLATEMSIPLVAHFHGFDATNPVIVQQYRDEYLKLFNYASGVIVVSSKMKADLIMLGCDENKIIMSPCGPNHDFLKISPVRESNHFLAVARFVDVKGYLFTITAFKKALEKHPAVRLNCIGEGPQLESCKQFVKILQLENHVTFSGAASHDEIKLAMSNSFAFVQHSVTLSDGLTEGSPVSVMEAMAASLPVVCSASGGMVDLVLHNNNGFLVEEFDTDSMAASMCSLIENKELAKSMGLAGRSRIISELTQERHLKSIEAEILRAIA